MLEGTATIVTGGTMVDGEIVGHQSEFEARIF